MPQTPAASVLTMATWEKWEDRVFHDCHLSSTVSDQEHSRLLRSPQQRMQSDTGGIREAACWKGFKNVCSPRCRWSLVAPLAESKASMSQTCLCINRRLANSVGIDLAAVGSWLERTGPFVVLLCLIWFYKHITGKKFSHFSILTHLSERVCSLARCELQYGSHLLTASQLRCRPRPVCRAARHPGKSKRPGAAAGGSEGRCLPEGLPVAGGSHGTAHRNRPAAAAAAAAVAELPADRPCASALGEWSTGYQVHARLVWPRARGDTSLKGGRHRQYWC